MLSEEMGSILFARGCNESRMRKADFSYNAYGIYCTYGRTFLRFTTPTYTSKITFIISA